MKPGAALIGPLWAVTSYFNPAAIRPKVSASGASP